MYISKGKVGIYTQQKLAVNGFYQIEIIIIILLDNEKKIKNK